MRPHPTLAVYRDIRDIRGDVLRVRAPGAAFGDLALVENPDGTRGLARVIELQRDLVTLQVFHGTRGLSSGAGVRLLGEPLRVACSDNILGRVFSGAGDAIDGGPGLHAEPRVDIAGPPLNPLARRLPQRMIHTGIPMIDLFNTLVESQKLPIFSIPGEPYNALLARVGFQADADVVVFGGLGLMFDDYHFFRHSFEQHGVAHRTVMFINLAGDPVVERLLLPDLALAVAEQYAVQHDRRVLVLLTDMTAYADAHKEIGISLERVPATRGHLGDLYTQLAQRYEKACQLIGSGSLTLLTVTTLPGNDITHPVPDNTGYITEGQIYLHDGVIDPFGSLSRLKQHVIGKATRDDHGQVMNAMVQLYAGAEEARRKQSMGFDLSAFDRRLLSFGERFRTRFMDMNVTLPLTAALDLAWSTMAELFAATELPLRKDLIARYFPADARVSA
ncbi:V-type ATP synthase subunit B [Immundisolibacter sp.]|uniref:V-type ATP synthase subunit B n=1 Tax=Immundisolibacter sp. TaxID=1934948 RepID=UPI0025BC9F4B|nr:V-type ATP synthase subunit B [Immundisolibacter sp.]